MKFAILNQISYKCVKFTCTNNMPNFVSQVCINVGSQLAKLAKKYIL